jgi:hypothetical protein
MRRHIAILFIVALALVVPGILLAQDDITLQSLSDRIDALFETSSDLSSRIEALETKVAPPPPTATPTITITPVKPTATPTETPTPVPAHTVPKYEFEDILDEYGANEARADAKYMGKTIEVNGIILDIEKKGGGFFSGKERYEITLEGEGFLSYLDCSLPLSSEEEVLQLNAGESVTLRGELYSGGRTIINMRNCEIIKE